MKLFDTFPTLEFNEEMMDILADVDVLKVATNSAKTRLRVYIVSKRLIPKHIIFALEDGFRKQIPPFKTLDIHVVESMSFPASIHRKSCGAYTGRVFLRN